MKTKKKNESHSLFSKCQAPDSRKGHLENKVRIGQNCDLNSHKGAFIFLQLHPFPYKIQSQWCSKQRQLCELPYFYTLLNHYYLHAAPNESQQGPQDPLANAQFTKENVCNIHTVKEVN